MIYAAPRLLPAGDAAILVELGDEISPEVNGWVYALDAAVRAASLPGVVETVPAYCTLLVEYDPCLLSYGALAGHLAAWTAAARRQPGPAGDIHEVPVRYGGEDGPDLTAVAAERGLQPEQVVALHSSSTYTVYMLGFSPGFAYLGTVLEAIAFPRLPTPRPRVPAGSVGIAGRQTGIYPQATPGGWRLIGRTDAALFDPYREQPSLLAPGDRVRFVPVPAQSAARARQLAGPPGAGRVSAAAGPRSDNPSRPAPPRGMPVLRVDEPGWLTTVQDLGRRGYQRFGVPVAGAVDPFALAAANALAGNPPGAAALEITMGGVALRVLAGTRAAIAGADLDATVLQPYPGAWRAPLWTDLYLRPGSVLEFRGPRAGCRAYLALAGGVAVARVMGSSSTYLAGGFGGYEGRGLRPGDVLSVQDAAGEVSPTLGGLSVPPERRPDYRADPEVRVVFGPHDDYFTVGARATLLSGEYQVSPTSDRMGLRLAGPRLEHADGRELISCGTVLGALQVPPDGQPIALMADRQTAGGYPVIATVVRADIPLLAQCLPGKSRVRFRAVSVEEAQAAWCATVGAGAPEDMTPNVLGF